VIVLYFIGLLVWILECELVIAGAEMARCGTSSGDYARAVPFFLLGLMLHVLNWIKPEERKLP
jgi:hypothetical protein